MSIRAPRLTLFILLVVASAFSQSAPKGAPLPYDPLEMATGSTVVPDTPEKRAVLLGMLECARQNSAMHTPGTAPYSHGPGAIMVGPFRFSESGRVPAGYSGVVQPGDEFYSCWECSVGLQ